VNALLFAAGAVLGFVGVLLGLWLALVYPFAAVPSLRPLWWGLTTGLTSAILIVVGLAVWGSRVWPAD
jgi:hypothetical protein